MKIKITLICHLFVQHGEAVYFNATLAARYSRAKWRATHVWKEDDQTLLTTINGLNDLNLIGSASPVCLDGNKDAADAMSTKNLGLDCMLLQEQVSKFSNCDNGDFFHNRHDPITSAATCPSGSHLASGQLRCRANRLLYPPPAGRRTWHPDGRESVTDVLSGFDLSTSGNGSELRPGLEAFDLDPDMDDLDDQGRRSALTIDDFDDIRFFDDSDYEDRLSLFNLASNYLKLQPAPDQDRLGGNLRLVPTSIASRAGSSLMEKATRLPDLRMTRQPRLLCDTGGALHDIEVLHPEEEDADEVAEDVIEEENKSTLTEVSSNYDLHLSKDLVGQKHIFDRGRFEALASIHSEFYGNQVDNSDQSSVQVASEEHNSPVKRPQQLGDQTLSSRTMAIQTEYTGPIIKGTRYLGNLFEIARGPIKIADKSAQVNKVDEKIKNHKQFKANDLRLAFGLAELVEADRSLSNAEVKGVPKAPNVLLPRSNGDGAAANIADVRDVL
ncbi:unnamed protein product [Protopolystoma xenopodis]|uniref:Condensin complex subunit 2 n=1 Tax=Protopolystoma xenopodis TaxID=117903 RepID=A0A448WGT1_9PLAT|nr:unnamed protein product [Protopolystoma xenopodis]